MVVDDATFMRMKCVDLLAQNGYDVVEADTGSRALEVYKESRPDAVLLDITMPDMDGITALTEIMKIDPSAKVAMVTALDQQGITTEALRRGASNFVVKPFNAETILTAVRELVGQDSATSSAPVPHAQ
jgi:two-component system chemotaxis response regulator CheY